MEEKREDLLALIGFDSAGQEIIPESVIKDIYLRAFILLPTQVDSFTMGDSSSVSSEIAEELLKSIFFTIRMAINANKSALNVLLSSDVRSIFRQGKAIVDSETEKGRQLLKAAMESAPTIQNISYRETLSGLAVFFEKYDSRFFAHEIPCSIDYQLCHNVSDKLLGIEYINEYLRLLLIENRFCALFEPSAMEAVLKSHSPQYKSLLINLYEPLAVNALGLALTGGEIRLLKIRAKDQAEITSLFRSLTKDDAANNLKASAEIVCHELEITDTEQRSYLEKTAEELYYRIASAIESDLAGVFPTSVQKKSSTAAKARYVDGKMMENSALRTLIDEISDCSLVSDKVQTVMLEVRSLRDLSEILDVCFWENESFSLFEAMGARELNILLDFARKRVIEDYSETGWEQKLFEFMRKNEDGKQ